jgi:hypothetical protein
LKKIAPILLIIVLLYNAIGYLIVFKGVQYSVKKEIKRKIKRSVPENELFLVKVTENDIDSHRDGFKFVEEEKEFVYKNKMYDVVERKTINDTIYLKCINDIQEEELFASLDQQIKQTLENSIPVKQKSLHLVQNIIKDGVITNKININSSIITKVQFAEISESTYITFHVVLTPPPNHHQNFLLDHNSI